MLLVLPLRVILWNIYEYLRYPYIYVQFSSCKKISTYKNSKKFVDLRYADVVQLFYNVFALLL